MNTTYQQALSDYKASHEFFIQECFEEWLQPYRLPVHKMVEIGYYITRSK